MAGIPDVNRRTIMMGMAATSAMPLIGGCRTQGDGGTSPPPDCTAPATNRDVTWVPDVAHPVSWGASDIGTEHGAPRRMMIYYPAASQSEMADLDDAEFSTAARAKALNSSARAIPLLRSYPILQTCASPFPVVLFLHGNMIVDALRLNAYRSWTVLASTLAKAGFVVVVPSHRASAGPNDSDVADALADVAWVRTQWAGARWVAAAISDVGWTNPIRYVAEQKVSEIYEWGRWWTPPASRSCTILTPIRRSGPVHLTGRAVSDWCH